MSGILIATCAAAVFASTAYAESRVPCNTLPAAVLNQAKIETRDATIRGCVKDRER